MSFLPSYTKRVLSAMPRKSGVRSDLGPQGDDAACERQRIDAELVSSLVSLSADISNALDMLRIALSRT